MRVRISRGKKSSSSHMSKNALGITAAVDRLYYGIFKLICLADCILFW